MISILKREMSAYFTSAIGYIFLAVYYFFAGYFFWGTVLYADTTDMSGVFVNLFTIMIFVVPILTMRLFSEEKRQKTDQALLTAPVRLSSIVAGKYLASLIVYLIGCAITLVFALVIAFFQPPDWTMVLGNFVGMVLMGASLLAIGMFISSLTENQLVAAVVSFAVIMALMMVQNVSSFVSWNWLKEFIDGISISQRYNSFTTGIFDLSNVLYFISIAVVFNFLTVRMLERKRWS